MNGDAVIVLQARLDSSRLPGKALAPVAGRSILRRCLDRLLAAGAGPVVLATTARALDDPLAALAEEAGAAVVRGPVEDVLGRFVLVTAMLRPAYVVRATADNPAVDLESPGRLLARLRRGGLDYCVERGLPVGATVEAMRADALLDAGARATASEDREHVTPFLRRPDSGFRVLEALAPTAVRRPDLRFTVDTPDDLAWMTRVFAQAGAGATTLPLAALIRAADRVPRREVA